jgi:hypothetical protein
VSSGSRKTILLLGLLAQYSHSATLEVIASTASHGHLMFHRMWEGGLRVAGRQPLWTARAARMPWHQGTGEAFRDR